MYDRMTTIDRAILEQIRPARVTRNFGEYTDVIARHEQEALLVKQAGLAGLRAVAPYLFLRATDERVLRAAFQDLSLYGGQAAGPDGVTYQDIIGRNGEWPFCRMLRDALRSRRYRPGPETIVSIPKSGGRGKRELVLQSIRDRVIQRAVLLIVQPLIDPNFDQRSFGFRPKRGRLHALAAAERFLLDDRYVWVSQDIKDAFRNVPVARLMQIVKKRLIDEKLTELIRRITSCESTPGLRQGGPLSPFLLNLYLDHFLDRKWREEHPKVPLIRFADDLLVPCRSASEARKMQRSLGSLLSPAGMQLRENPKNSVHRVIQDRPIEWLGYSVDVFNEQLRVRIPDAAFDRLEEAIRACQHEQDRVTTVVAGWLTEMGPCYRWCGQPVETVLKRVRRIVHAQGGKVRMDRMKETWEKAANKWHAIRRH